MAKKTQAAQAAYEMEIFPLVILLLKSCSPAELLSSSDSKIKIKCFLKKAKKIFGLIIEFETQVFRFVCHEPGR
jgi:hypothetical protein